MRLVGPNCIGSVGVATGQVSSFSPLFSGERTELVPGAVGFVSQSRALGYGAVSLAFERGLGLGWVVNTGNEADVSAVEVMDALTREPGCRGVLAYLETLGDVEGLRAVAATGTPLAVLKAGRSTPARERPPPTPGPSRPATGWSTPPCASSASCARTTSTSCSTSAT